MSNILPNALVRKLGANPYFDEQAFLDAHANGNKLTSIRLNPFKRTSFDFNLDNPVAWCDLGYYLNTRPKFTLDPLFHAGCYYVQEASSMFIAHILSHLGLEDDPIKALDLCAAPGGKSTLLNSYLNPKSFLVANEIIKARASILQDNLVRWGMLNTAVSNNDPSAFKRLPGFFDLVMVDAPCSGSGMFRKDEDSIDEWSEAAVKLCSERQKRILADMMACLASYGTLIYSTCSYSEEENEAIVDWLMDEYAFESIQIPIQDSWGMEETKSTKHQGFGYRFYPHQVEGEGFFVAVLKLKDVQPSFALKKLKVEKPAVDFNMVKQWMNAGHELATLVHNDEVHVFLKEHELFVKAIQQVLYLKNVGTNIGKWMGRELLPSHDLAMSIYLNDDIQSVELDLNSAQDYLRKETLPIDYFSNASKGWCLVKYKGISLGGVKALGNRINNYYPKELRITNL